MLDRSPTQQAAIWLHSFSEALESGNVAAVSALFLEECYWRDLLTFTWNIKTMEGRSAIEAMLSATLARTKPSDWQIAGEATRDGDTVEA